MQHADRTDGKFLLSSQSHRKKQIMLLWREKSTISATARAEIILFVPFGFKCNLNFKGEE